MAIKYKIIVKKNGEVMATYPNIGCRQKCDRIFNGLRALEEDFEFEVHRDGKLLEIIKTETKA